MIASWFTGDIAFYRHYFLVRLFNVSTPSCLLLTCRAFLAPSIADALVLVSVCSRRMVLWRNALRFPCTVCTFYLVSGESVVKSWAGRSRLSPSPVPVRRALTNLVALQSSESMHCSTLIDQARGAGFLDFNLQFNFWKVFRCSQPYLWSVCKMKINQVLTRVLFSCNLSPTISGNSREFMLAVTVIWIRKRK